MEELINGNGISTNTFEKPSVGMNKSNELILSLISIVYVCMKSAGI